MATRKTARIGFMGRSGMRDMLDLFLGVLSYKNQVDHWQLIGMADDPIINESEVDLHSVDGLIGFFYSTDWERRLSEAGVAAVNLSTAIEELHLPRVVCDEAAVGRIGAEHLLSCGFVHFGFFDLYGGWTGKLRKAGFADVVQKHAGRSCYAFEKNKDAKDISKKIEAWLQELPKPIAIMAMDDSCGRKLIDHAVSQGIRVPEDVAVLGVNNDSWLTELAAVPMSSIQMNKKEIGYQGARMLDGLLAGHAPRETRWIPPLGVVVRKSTDVIVSGDPIISKALTFIREHCYEGITVEDVVSRLHVSRRTLEVRLKRTTGQTPQTAIFRAQINRARKMLVGTDYKIWKIANECGFDCEPRFFLVFKRETGMTPTQYRQETSSPSQSEPPNQT